MNGPGVLQVIEGRNVLRFERRYDHPVDEVWRALTQAESLKAWFPATIAGGWDVGAKLTFVFVEFEGPDTFGEVLAYDPLRILEYTWDTDTLRFELEPDGEGCRMVFLHAFPDKAGAASFASGWEVCFAALEKNVFGDEPSGVSPEDWAKLHEEYVPRLGLDFGVADKTDSGWMVRFERQLIKPVDFVWEFLTEGAKPGIGDAPPLRFTNGYIESGWVTAIEPEKLLKYEWIFEGEKIGAVRWELSPGVGGARLALTQTIDEEFVEKRFLVLAAWHTHIEVLAGFLSGKEQCWPEGRVEELEGVYQARGVE